MPSEEIGYQVEGLLKSFLERIGMVIPASLPSGVESGPIIIPEDLRLMNSGSQHGLDLNWIIKFSNQGNEYTWYFEAKGFGFTKYFNNRNKKHEAFHINLISDKLLQSLSFHAMDIDCWCLFAPYIKLDEGDITELDNINEYLPFKLVFWDKDFLFSRLKSIDNELFQAIYPQDTLTTLSVVDPSLINNLVAKIKNKSVEGRFWNLVHKRYSAIKREIVERCQLDLVFESVPAAQTNDGNDIPRETNTSHYFLYKNAKYITSESDLSNADDIEGIKRLLANAKDETNSPLITQFQTFLNIDDNPYLSIEVKHRSGNFRGRLAFNLLTSSTNLGCTQDKPVLFKVIDENI